VLNKEDAHHLKHKLQTLEAILHLKNKNWTISSSPLHKGNTVEFKLTHLLTKLDLVLTLPNKILLA